MGIFSKLKNVLFEEEEIEVPVKEEPKRRVKEPQIAEEPPKVVKMTFEEEEKKESILSDRELFKAEKTFDFPDFDDEEFASMKQVEEKPKSMGINILDHERPKIKKEPRVEKTPEIKGRAYAKDVRTTDNQKFRPSPVISPVYGVLDKNYKKEDVIIKEEKKAINVNDVRKKAFGTLENDLEKTLTKPVKNFYDEKPKPKVEEPEIEEKSIEDLLEETAFDTIEIPKEENETKEIPVVNEEQEIEPIDKPKKKVNVEEDTIENDLFDLIDSMYEEQKEEE